jgi:shikimate dehydrogenase
VLALLGHPVAGNPTQYMVEQALAHHDLDWEYLSLDVSEDDLGDAVRGIRALGFRGGNCADPHKQGVIQFLNRITPAAEMAGAVNCILREEQHLVGENTEGTAFLQTLRRRIDPAGKQCVLLGAGRVARAIAVQLATAGAATITVVDRDQAAARHVVDLLTSRLGARAALAAWEGDYAAPPETEVLVHATPLGTGDEDDRVPLDLESLSPATLVADVVTNPPRTRLLRQAAERGCPTLDGLEVLIAQTAVNFRLWTGVDPDLGAMREAVEEFLEL